MTSSSESGLEKALGWFKTARVLLLPPVLLVALGLGTTLLFEIWNHADDTDPVDDWPWAYEPTGSTKTVRVMLKTMTVSAAQYLRTQDAAANPAAQDAAKELLASFLECAATDRTSRRLDKHGQYVKAAYDEWVADNDGWPAIKAAWDHIEHGH